MSCQPGLIFCQGGDQWTCNNSAEAELSKRCADNETCSNGDCQINPTCFPGEIHCQDDTLLSCPQDGSAYDQMDCAPGICLDGQCQDPVTNPCDPGQIRCQNNSVAICTSDSSWMTSENCDDARCLDGQCQDVICTPGVANCQNDVVMVCDETGTSRFVRQICRDDEQCLNAVCEHMICPASRWCDGDRALFCNSDGTTIIGQQDCATGQCHNGVCQGQDAGQVVIFDAAVFDALWWHDAATTSDHANPRDAGVHDVAISESGTQDLLNRDRTSSDLLFSDRRGQDVSQQDRSIFDRQGTDLAQADSAYPDHSGIDLNPHLRDGSSYVDCRVQACVGFSYCDESSGQCLYGCSSNNQCVSGSCKIETHQCMTADAGGQSGSDAALINTDGSGNYETDSGAIIEELCPASEQIPPACMQAMDEGAAGLCDGLDNDCDGHVDEGCPCNLGDVQRCFRGPPGRQNVGACEDGQQTCISRISSRLDPPVWGPCEGGIAPRAEVCDGLDNDCNGCADEIEGCTGLGSCPGPGDPRVPEGAPFSTYPLYGSQFYSGDDAISWRWSIVGSPCDRMFLRIPGSPATPDNGQLSFRLIRGDHRDAALAFTLSGDYEITLDVGLADGGHFACTWIVHVRAPGLRVELCWDVTGPTSPDTALDIDLHLGKFGNTGRWFEPKDCFYATCQGDNARGLWSYPSSPLSACTGTGSRGGFSESCPNPRLDIDNINEIASYVPENINLDKPNDGDHFRVMVHHYTFEERAAKPLVNIYCGGELRGSYGAPPDQVLGFRYGGGDEHGSMWRVVDVTMQVDGSGATNDCDLSPLTNSEGDGYNLSVDDSTF